PEGRNSDFFSLMVQLTDALAKIGSDPIAAVLPTSQDLLRTAAEALAENLLPRTRGITLFAAQELVRDTREALAVFEQRSIQQALGESTVWGAVRGVSRLYLGEQPDVTSHLTRGKAGSILLAWLAQVSPRLGHVGGALVSARDPMVNAAAAWISASLSLEHGERGTSHRGV